jgi:hypothetical protein
VVTPGAGTEDELQGDLDVSSHGQVRTEACAQAGATWASSALLCVAQCGCFQDEE